MGKEQYELMLKYNMQHPEDPAAFNRLNTGIAEDTLMYLKEHRLKVSYDFYYNRFEIEDKRSAKWVGRDLEKLVDEVKQALKEDEII